jgi:hypothetical protein
MPRREYFAGLFSVWWLRWDVASRCRVQSAAVLCFCRFCSKLGEESCYAVAGTDAVLVLRVQANARFACLSPPAAQRLIRTMVCSSSNVPSHRC